MVFLSQNLYNCNIPLTNELKLYAKDLLFNFYTESLTLFYCVPFRIFFLEPTKLSLTCPASIYGIASTRHDGNRGANGKCNFNFRIS